MAYALRSSTGPVELLPGLAVVTNDVQFSYATMLLWSDAERAAYGIFPIVEPPDPPAGEIVSSSSLSDDGTTVTRTVTLISAPPAPIPDVSDRQFFQALANAGKITEDEALAYVGPGTLPSAIVAGINQLPTDQQFAVKMLLIGARTFERTDPLADQMGAILGYDSAGLDALWQAAALL